MKGGGIVSTVDSMVQMSQLQYSVTNSSSSSSSLLSEIAGGSTQSSTATTAILTQAENAVVTNVSNAELQANQTGALVQFQSYASSLNEAATELSPSLTGFDDSSDDSSSTGISADNINNFVTAFNNLVSYASSNQQYISSDALSGLQQGVTDELPDLQSIGITQNSDGTLSVDQDTLSSSIENDPDSVASVITGVDGLASNSYLATNDITNSPLSTFAANLTSASTGSTDFYNFVGQQSTSQMWSSLLGQFLNTNG